MHTATYTNAYVACIYYSHSITTDKPHTSLSLAEAVD